MARRLLILIFLVVPALARAEFEIDASVELALVDGGPMPSFTDGSQGKLRYGDDGIELSSAFVQISATPTPTLETIIAIDVNPQARDDVGITEAAIVLRPLPIAGVKPRLKLGAFRPPISLEHSSLGWGTLYTTSASALNSWVGEELGGLGIEASVRSDPTDDPYGMYWSLTAAPFYGNDPAGTLLSWRGWSVNNWQTSWGGVVPLAQLPIFQVVPDQAPQIEPFLELDDRLGYYVGGEIGRAGSFRLRALHYDNRADPTIRNHGQVGWRTQFDSIGIAGGLPFDVGVIAQWLAGRTYAGPQLSWGRPIDNDFDTYFVLVTRTWGGHRFSMRREWFGVDDNDANALDPNEEQGDAWTLSYQFRFDEHWLAGIEWIRIDSERPARIFENADVDLIEQSVFAVVRWTY